MPRIVVEHLNRLAPHRGLRGIDLAQIQHVTLHDAPARHTLVLDDAPKSCVLPSFFLWVFRRNMTANLS